MTTRRLIPLALVVAAVLVGAVLTLGKDGGYSVHVALNDAAGLRQGSKVAMGGVDVGKVALKIGDDDRVDMELKIRKKFAPLPQDAHIAIVASNLLGQKHVEIVAGTGGQAASSGAWLPSQQVSVGTDLDQVLNVLDADTRTRLSIVLNEAGTAVAGRKTDLAHILDALPNSFAMATETVQQLVKDNQQLGRALVSTDSFVAEATARRKDLRRLVQRLGGATETLASRRRELRSTLAAAPHTLQQLQGFLTDLKQTTVPLGPAAREISASAPLLNNLLAEVEPLRVAADPTLKTATKVAPDLTRLAVGASPVVRRARPPADALKQLAQALPPLTTTLNKSSDNLLATADNWTRAIQFRDGLSHVFRGEASVSPDLLLSAIKRAAPDVNKKNAGKDAKPTKRPLGGGDPSKSPVPSVKTPTLPEPLQKLIDALTGGDKTPVGKTVNDAVGAVTGLLKPKGTDQGGKSGTRDSSTDSAQGLLDFLLGSK